jgi:hypothetical protein
MLHITLHADEVVLDRLHKIEHQLTLLRKEIAELMALSQESKDLLAKIDKATTSVSDRIDALLANPNTTEAEFRAALQPIADHLDSLGKVADPFPVLPPNP